MHSYWEGQYYRWHPTNENDRIHSNQVYKNLHDAIWKKYQGKIKLEQDIEDAKLLEDFFYGIKLRMADRKKNFKLWSPQSYFNDAKGGKYFKTLLEDKFYSNLIEEIGQNSAIKPDFFYHLRQPGEAKGVGGFLFEEGFAQVIAKSLNLAIQNQKVIKMGEREISTNYKFSKNNFMTGTVLAGIKGGNANGTYEVTNDEFKGLMGLITKDGQTELQKILLGSIIKDQKKEKENDNSNSKLTGKSQKVDIQRQQGEIEIRGTTLVDKALKLIYTKNFSLKQYASPNNSVTIDNTVPFRAIMSPITSLEGVDRIEALKIYSQGIHAKPNNVPTVIGYMNKIKMIYGYSGFGQMQIQSTRKGNILTDINETADFLVINDPQSTDIQVHSIRQILADYLKTAPFEEHKLKLGIHYSRESYKQRGKEIVT